MAEMKDSERKEIAERGREIVREHGPEMEEQLTKLFNTIDPPRPDPNSFVWWRWGVDPGSWQKGIVSSNNNYIIYGSGVSGYVPIEDIEYKPAYILGPDEVAANRSDIDSLRYYINNPSAWEVYNQNVSDAIESFITRTEAERNADG